MTTISNTARFLTLMAREHCGRTAILEPVSVDRHKQVAFNSVTYAELEDLCNAYAALFQHKGVEKGTKMLMMMRPGIEFTAATFAAFKIGAVPVLIDPGMGRRNFLSCVRDTRPEAMLAISPVHWLRPLFRRDFSSVRLSFSLGAFPPPLVTRLERTATASSIKETGAARFPEPETALDDPAAILFTTGSTGPAKGVLYTHRTFIAQVEMIRKLYDAGPQHVDMSAFPLFALFAVAMGMKTVIPKMDFTRPAEVDAEMMVNTIKSQNVSFSFGSPALWRTVAAYCLKNGLRMPTLRRVLMAGAPVSAHLHEQVLAVISPEGETRVPYGATEALPITDFNGREMLADTATRSAGGEGYCVGRVNPGLKIKVIRNTPDAIPEWDESLVLPTGEKGEIVVCGEVVTHSYHQKPEATAKAKIRDAAGVIWHRMGDMGYFDQKGRLWFCGRKTHMVTTPERTYYSVCVEAVYNNHPRVFRSALVGVEFKGRPSPVLMVQPRPGQLPVKREELRRFKHELRKTAEHYDICKGIDIFIFVDNFPVDIRHNAKIFREKLAVVAAAHLRKYSHD